MLTFTSHVLVVEGRVSTQTIYLSELKITGMSANSLRVAGFNPLDGCVDEKTGKPNQRCDGKLDSVLSPLSIVRLVWFGGEKQGGGKKRGASAKGRNRSQQLSARLQALQKTYTARQETTEAKESVVK